MKIVSYPEEIVKVDRRKEEPPVILKATLADDGYVQNAKSTCFFILPSLRYLKNNRIRVII